jgi:hypothetical protein
MSGIGGRDSGLLPSADATKPYRFVLDETILRYRSAARSPRGGDLLQGQGPQGYYELVFRKVVQSLVDNLAYIYTRIDVCVFSRQNPSVAREYYHRNPLSLKALGYAARDSSGRELTPEVVHQYDSNIEFHLHFKNKKDGAFYIYKGQTIDITSSFKISEQQWGPWLERHVRCDCDELAVEMHFPSDSLRSIVGHMWSPTKPSDSLIQPRITTRTTDDESIYLWKCTSPEMESRYRLSWAFRDAREQKVVRSFKTDNTRRPLDFEIVETDFSVVRWRQEIFRFSPTQAAAVRELYRAWQKGYAPAGKRILEQIGSDLARIDGAETRKRGSQLLRVFRMRKPRESPGNTYHPAWNRLIVHGPSPGTFTLDVSIQPDEGNE